MNRFQILLIALSLAACPSCGADPVEGDVYKDSSLVQLEFAVEEIGPDSGRSFVNLSAQNHGEALVQGLFVEVTFYNGLALVGQTSHVFDSLGVGELKSAELAITPGGRPWSHWEVSDSLEAAE